MRWTQSQLQDLRVALIVSARLPILIEKNGFLDGVHQKEKLIELEREDLRQLTRESIINCGDIKICT
jgi:hypothetical protein